MRNCQFIARIRILFSFFIILFTFQEHYVRAHDPLALHQLIEVPVGGEEVISLLGYDLDGDETIATITILPKSGTLYQLSYVYNKYGYEPKIGKPILQIPTVVTGDKSRIVYVRPPPPTDREPMGRWDQFQYTVSDSDGKTQSLKGTVTLVGPSHILVASDFRSSSEEWTVSTASNANERKLDVKYEESSKGLLMNHYIYAADDSLNIDSTGNDVDLWLFVAPHKFTGNHGIFYGGIFEFTLSSFGGDFSKLNSGKVFNGEKYKELNLVEIHCAQCNLDNGITIAYPLSATPSKFHGSTQQFSLKMIETFGWKKDPKNVLLEWVPPTKCEFIEVLSGISSVKILGDFTTWYESVSIDNVIWKMEMVKGRKQLPPCAQNKPNGRKCTC